jgi:two-component system response regulator QseB
MRLLIIEDDRTIAENLFEYLESRGHRCDWADGIGLARRLLEAEPFDALVLDRNLPDGDGLSLVRRLRAAGNPVPVLVLTARDRLEDKLLGFESGGDDYLVKPFALQEVEARLLALVRRPGLGPPIGLLRFGALEYDPERQEIRRAGQTLILPPKAMRLLALMMAHPDRVFSRRELELAVWGHENDTSDSLRSLLHTVRRALGDSPGERVINAHGLGYRLARD